MSSETAGASGAVRCLCCAVLGSLLALAGCGRIAGIEALRCEAACKDEATRIFCDSAGTVRTEACPISREECAIPACEAGSCTFKPAVGAPCGETGGAYCNEGYACLGASIYMLTLLRHTCIAAVDGKVWCWGDNTYRQLGDGTDEPGLHPVLVRGLPEPASQVSPGAGHTCALLRTGEVYCWGDNRNGQCGVPHLDLIPAPVLVRVPGVRFIDLKSAEKHTCAVTESFTVYCWGNTEYGQCGSDPAVTAQRIVGPMQVPKLSAVSAIQVVKDHNCAIRSETPTVVCWGSNSHARPSERPYVNGKLGPAAGELPYSAEPIPIDLGVPLVMSGLGPESTYAVTQSGHVYAWGSNDRSQLGIDSRESVVRTPALVMRETETGPVPLAGVTSAAPSAGPDQCMWMADRTEFSASFFCWGADDWGELGAGTEKGARAIHRYAVPVRALPSTAGWLSRGVDHTCAPVFLEGRTEIQCFGRPGFLGDGSPPAEDGDTPTRWSAAPVVWDAANFAPALAAEGQ